MYLWGVIPPRKGIGDDIKKPGETELPYDKMPARGIAQLARFLKVVQGQLPRVRQPLLLFNSSEDHVVPRGNAELVMDRVGSTDKELVALPNSYHVATLDYDAELIFERTHEFAEAHAVRVDHSEEPLEEELLEEPEPEVGAATGETADSPEPADESSGEPADPTQDPDEPGPDSDNREQPPG
jgi:hypothetical protein